MDIGWTLAPEIASISAEGRPWPISLEGEIGRRNVSRRLFSFRLNCRGSQETAALTGGDRCNSINWKGA